MCNGPRYMRNKAPGRCTTHQWLTPRPFVHTLIREYIHAGGDLLGALVGAVSEPGVPMGWEAFKLQPTE